MQNLYKMTANHVAIAALHLHNNVRPGKWLYQQGDETITPTLLGTMIEKSIGQDRAHIVIKADGSMTGTPMSVLTDTTLLPMVVVVAIDPKMTRDDMTRTLWKLWHDAAFMRHTTIFVSAGDIIDPALMNRMVKFGYLAEDAA